MYIYIYTYVYVYIHSSLSILSMSVSGHLGFLHLSAILNSDAVNIGVHVIIFELEFSPDICLGMGLLNHITTLFLVF